MSLPLGIHHIDETPAPSPTVDALADLMAGCRRVMVLTGAGCSTESGIPDYRGPDGSWRHAKPMTYQEFRTRRSARRRYWARSAVGWRRIAEAEPNGAHRALARLQELRTVDVVTQNVDGLHQKAGSRRVIDLHGRLDRIECLECATGYRREPFQAELARLNPDWNPTARVVRPDGDADLGDADYQAFALPVCPRCGGDLKPGVVFFGEPVPRRRTEAAFTALERADALLVVGSSLMVWSGYRFARRAAESGKPVALVNLGRTRADGEATLKLAGRCGEVLPRVVARLA